MTAAAMKEAAGEGALVVKYDVTDAAIGELKERFKGISFATPASYEEGRKAIGTLRDLRGKVEKRRKDLKADSLAFGRKVDAAARHLTDLIEAIENPLQEAKRAVDEEEARKAREAEKAELLALEAKLKADREEAEAKARAARDAEEARLAAERERMAADRARFAAAEEAARLERERIAAEQRAAQEKIDAERRELDAQRAAVQAQQEAAARAEAAKRAEAERVERERLEAEQKAARDAAEAARLEKLKPDIEKLRAYADAIRSLGDDAPVLESHEATEACAWATKRLAAIAAALDQYGAPAATETR